MACAGYGGVSYGLKLFMVEDSRLLQPVVPQVQDLQHMLQFGHSQWQVCKNVVLQQSKGVKGMRRHVVKGMRRHVVTRGI